MCVGREASVLKDFNCVAMSFIFEPSRAKFFSFQFNIFAATSGYGLGERPLAPTEAPPPSDVHESPISTNSFPAKRNHKRFIHHERRMSKTTDVSDRSAVFCDASVGVCR
jgi:hypothetical protein